MSNEAGCSFAVCLAFFTEKIKGLLAKFKQEITGLAANKCKKDNVILKFIRFCLLEAKR